MGGSELHSSKSISVGSKKSLKSRGDNLRPCRISISLSTGCVRPSDAYTPAFTILRSTVNNKLNHSGKVACLSYWPLMQALYD